MRILLIHSEDDMTTGPWTNQPWDRIVDFGFASRDSSELRRSAVGCLPSLGDSDFGRIRRALEFGSRALIDDHGLDWWSLLSIEFHQHLEKIQSLRRFAQTVAPVDEIAITRSSFDSRVLEVFLGRELNVMARPDSIANKLMRRGRLALKFRPKQIAEI